MSDPSAPGDPQPQPGEGALPPPPENRSPLPFIIAGAVLVVLLGAVALALVLGGGDDDKSEQRTHTTTSADKQAKKARNEDNPDDIRVPDADRPDDLGDDAQLNRLAHECFDGDPSSCDDLYVESDLGSDYEDYGSKCGGRLEDGQAGGCAKLYPDPDYADLRTKCADGDNGACDDLYTDTPPGSVDEAFGSTCGHRSDTELAGSCKAENP